MACGLRSSATGGLIGECHTLRGKSSMNINISVLINSEFNPHDIYGSVATHGEDVADLTWSEALEYAKVLPNFLGIDELEAAFRQYVEAIGFGAYDDLDTWGLMDFAALFLQLVAAEMVDAGFDPQNPDWDLLANHEGCHIFGGHHSTDGEAYYALRWLWALYSVSLVRTYPNLKTSPASD